MQLLELGNGLGAERRLRGEAGADRWQELVEQKRRQRWRVKARGSEERILLVVRLRESLTMLSKQGHDWTYHSRVSLGQL